MSVPVVHGIIDVGTKCLFNSTIVALGLSVGLRMMGSGGSQMSLEVGVHEVIPKGADKLGVPVGYDGPRESVMLENIRKEKLG